MARFEGQVAVVTGGVSGIGFAVAQRLVAEGARLAVWDVNAAALADASARLGTQVHTVALDLADADAVQGHRRAHLGHGAAHLLGLAQRIGRIGLSLHEQ